MVGRVITVLWNELQIWSSGCTGIIFTAAALCRLQSQHSADCALEKIWFSVSTSESIASTSANIISVSVSVSTVSTSANISSTSASVSTVSTGANIISASVSVSIVSTCVNIISASVSTVNCRLQSQHSADCTLEKI